MIITVHRYDPPYDEYSVCVYGIVAVFPPDPTRPATRILFSTQGVYPVRESYENVLAQIKAATRGDDPIAPDFTLSSMSEVLTTYDNPTTNDESGNVPDNTNEQEPVATSTVGVLRPLPPHISQQIHRQPTG